uniref:Uncharacterized protein n=1 Tax=Romanomermis culicivorax TaxID=13658 RepID=A0A915KHS9_ROMCU
MVKDTQWLRSGKSPQLGRHIIPGHTLSLHLVPASQKFGGLSNRFGMGHMSAKESRDRATAGASEYA